MTKRTNHLSIPFCFNLINTTTAKSINSKLKSFNLSRSFKISLMRPSITNLLTADSNNCLNKFTSGSNKNKNMESSLKTNSKRSLKHCKSSELQFCITTTSNIHKNSINTSQNPQKYSIKIFSFSLQIKILTMRSSKIKRLSLVQSNFNKQQSA